MYHIVYQTTNLINGKIYVGKHTTKNLNDGYIGSGKRLHQAIKIYGVENFVCEHLFFAFTEKYAYEIENEIVNLEFLQRKDIYNLAVGGISINSGIKQNQEWLDKRICRGKNHYSFGTHKSEKWKQNHASKILKNKYKIKTQMV